jgi:ribonuclease HI
MSDTSVWTVHIDGAARGNPGPAAYAFVLQPGDGPAIEEKDCLGSATNNVAEYTALVRALRKAAELGAQRLLIHSDSELLVKQMNGEYRVKNEALRELFDEAKQLAGRFRQVTIRHVPRAQNSRADQLCNEALDGAGKADRRGNPARGDKKPAVANPSRIEAIHEEAVACLAAAAGAWRRGDARAPRPEDVWEQLWSILEEHGLVRTGSQGAVGTRGDCPAPRKAGL